MLCSLFVPLRTWFARLLAAAGTASLLASPAPAADNDLPARLDRGAHVLMMRHANAPGFGDPPGFRLGDCASQRNLDDTGRAQAIAAGDWLRARGVRTALVYSSEWCRTLETARLLGFGQPTPLAALNSFFERPQDGAATTRALLEFLEEQPADGPLVILVTHQVNIQAIADTSVGSGEAVLLLLRRNAPPSVVGRFDFEGNGPGD